jgi:hypothetical protein
MKLQIVYYDANGDRQIFWPADARPEVVKAKLDEARRLWPSARLVGVGA